MPLILIFLYGAYGLIKNSKPEMFSIKMIGFYLVLIGLLSFCHINYVTSNNSEVMAT